MHSSISRPPRWGDGVGVDGGRHSCPQPINANVMYISPILTSSSSSSTSRSRTRRSQDNTLSSTKSHGSCKLIFHGLHFLLTGLDNTSVYNLESIEKSILGLGGNILETEDKLLCCHKDGRHASTFLIASPCAFRRPKFLTALSVGVSIVHPQWVLESASFAASQTPHHAHHTHAHHSSTPPAPVRADSYPDFHDYLLASGSSPLHPYFVFRQNSSKVSPCYCLPPENAIRELTLFHFETRMMIAYLMHRPHSLI